MELASRLWSLHEDLGEFSSGDYPAGQVANVFNALLEQVKATVPGDPIVGVIESIPRDQMGGSTMEAGSMRAVTRQLYDAVRAAE